VQIVHYSYNSGCCIKSVAPWIAVLSWHSIHKGWYITNLLLCYIPQNKAPHTGLHHIWRTYTLCPFFGHKKNTDGSTVGLMILLASVCYCNSGVAKHFLSLHLVFQPIWGWGDLLFFPASSIKFLTKSSLKSRWVYLAPHEDNSIQLLSIANNYNGLPFWFSPVRLAQFQKPDVTDMNVFYSDSKTDLKLRCDYCIKFQLFKGAQDFLADWRMCVVCYYPTTPTDYPSTTTGTSMGPSCSCKHRSSWRSPIYEQ